MPGLAPGIFVLPRRPVTRGIAPQRRQRFARGGIIASAAAIRRDHAGVIYPCHIMTLNHFTDPSTNLYRRFAGSHEEVEMSLLVARIFILGADKSGRRK